MAEVSVDEIGEITSWLSTSGFTVESERESTSFGDRVQEWRRGDVRYRVSRDRGQWFVDTARSDWHDWFDIDLVSWVCDLREDTALGRAKAAATVDLDHLLPALQAARRGQVEDRLGIVLPPRHVYPDHRD